MRPAFGALTGKFILHILPLPVNISRETERHTRGSGRIDYTSRAPDVFTRVRGTLRNAVKPTKRAKKNEYKEGIGILQLWARRKKGFTGA